MCICIDIVYIYTYIYMYHVYVYIYMIHIYMHIPKYCLVVLTNFSLVVLDLFVDALWQLY